MKTFRKVMEKREPRKRQEPSEFEKAFAEKFLTLWEKTLLFLFGKTPLFIKRIINFLFTATAIIVLLYAMFISVAFFIIFFMFIFKIILR